MLDVFTVYVCNYVLLGGGSVVQCVCLSVARHYILLIAAADSEERHVEW